MANEIKISAELKKKMRTAALKAIKQRSTKDVEKTAQRIKQEMIAEFLAHPVTKELSEKNTAQNYSQTLVGYGNLYSFIGFDYPEDPVAPILELLNAIKIDSRLNGNSLFLYIRVPTPEDVWAVTPMPWADGRSWAKGIESGISGLNFYLSVQKAGVRALSAFEDSRSGTAIQSSKKVSPSARFNPTQYISTLLKKYKTKFSSLGKKSKNIFTEVTTLE
jgi:hypothetical protein